MALTKISRSLLDTGISDSSDATAITIDSSENVLLSNTTSLIGVNTSDGSDNKSVMVNGGGAASDSRGAYIWAKGNEHSDTGALQLVAGNVSGGVIKSFTSGSERMRIDSSGNVGIGTTSPSSYYSTNLVVGAPTNGGITLAASSTTASNYLMFADGTSGTDRYKGYVSYGHNADELNLVSSGFMRFFTDTGQTEKVRIDSSGNVGIGNSSPTNLLHLYKYQADTDIRLQGSAGSYYITNDYSDDALTFIHNSTERMRIDSSGNVGIGTTSPTDLLHLVSAAPILKTEATNNSSGFRIDVLGQSTGQALRVLKDTATTLFTVDISGNVTAAGSISDERLKEDISLINNPLDKIKQIKGITYKLKESGYIGTGLIAQDLQKVLPEAVYEVNEPEKNDESYLAINYGNTVGLLVEAIKEQQEQIEALQSEINTLKGG
jgi:hypothetical protein